MAPSSTPIPPTAPWHWSPFGLLVGTVLTLLGAGAAFFLLPDGFRGAAWPIGAVGLIGTAWGARRRPPADAGSEELGPAVFGQMAEGVIAVDAREHLLIMNPPARAVFGTEADVLPVGAWPEHFGVCLHDGHTPCPPTRFPLSRALAGETVDAFELCIRRAETPDVWIRGSARPLTNAEGRRRGAVMVLRDVSTTKRAEATLAAERSRRDREHARARALHRLDASVHEPAELISLFDRATTAMQESLPAHRVWVTITDPELSPLVPSSPGAALPATDWIIEHGHPLAVADIADDPFGTDEPSIGAYIGVPLRGDERVLGVLFATDVEPRVFDQDDHEFLTAAAARLTTSMTKVALYERLHALNVSLARRGDELAEQEQRFRTLADTAPVLIWMSETAGEIEYVNRAWRRFAGDGNAAPDWRTMLMPDEHDRVVDALEGAYRGGTSIRLEHRMRRYDGSERWFVHSAAPKLAADGACIGLIGTCLDITEQKAIERERARQRDQLEALVQERTAELEASHRKLRDADRLAAIGTLTAGLGHDMNNVLLPVRYRLDALDWDRAGAHRDLLESVRHAVDYLQQLTDGLRHFTLDPDDDRAALELVDLAGWWNRIRPLVTRGIPDNVELLTEIDDRLPRVRVAPHRLTQSMLNLVVNAGEAMPDGGTVTIRFLSAEDDTVAIEVRDTGHGMDAEVRRHIFDPFFTTKTRRLSTGLGLSLVHGFVHAADGTIDVESAPEAGTTFRIRLPAAGPNDAADATPRGRATISLRDPRTAAWIGGLLQTAAFDVENGTIPAGDLWVTDADPDRLETARRFLEERPTGQILAIGAAAPEWEDLAAAIVTNDAGLDAVHAAIQAVLAHGADA